jgi:carboxypeptidase Taq
MEKKFKQLLALLAEADDIGKASGVLFWDQSTYMPEGGAPARGRQSATLARLAHEKATNSEIGKLLDELQPLAEKEAFDSFEASVVRVARRAYDQAVRVPAAFVGEFTEHAAHSYAVWATSRPANDFKKVQPYLEKTLDYSRRLADFFPGYDHIADPLIDFADYGMCASSVCKIFAALRKELVPMVKAIASQAPINDACLRAKFSKDKQLNFGRQVAEAIGYDFKRGRMDLTHHPFSTTFSIGDVRITTRVNENDLGDCLFSVVHESGHAMYEQGVHPDFENTPLQSGTSAGVHESQSRLWENVVGRSRGFWEYFYPGLQKAFPKHLKGVELDIFHKAINKVEPSLTRTDADEVTYNLHVMIRFDLELAMLEGNLAIKDLPEAWNERYRQDIGVVAPDDRDGVLQDVHWYFGTIGGSFQGYTLGNIMSGLFYGAALKAHPEITGEIRQGKFDTLHNWLIENIYQHGLKFTANELIQRVTGGELTIAPYMHYLKSKYGELYGVKL